MTQKTTYYDLLGIAPEADLEAISAAYLRATREQGSGGEADALHLATRKGAALSIQRQVAQSDLFEEFEPIANLSLELPHVGFLLIGDFECIQPLQGMRNVEAGEFMNV